MRAAALYTLIGTARMNGIEPEVWLTDVIARIGAHPINRLAELLPWTWQPQATPPEPAPVKRKAQPSPQSRARAYGQ